MSRILVIFASTIVLAFYAYEANANAINMTEVKNSLESTSRVQSKTSLSAEEISHVEKKDMGKEGRAVSEENEADELEGSDDSFEEATLGHQRKQDEEAAPTQGTTTPNATAGSYNTIRSSNSILLGSAITCLTAMALGSN